ncbi:MAG TPA: DNA topology modulation protein [Pyrinomonadaceae bacterium]|jgi:adenylate kinase family enzyme
MKKVLIIGSSGAGKSTFSRRLGEATGLPVVHLDMLYWNPGWVETPKDEWSEKVEKALSGDEWILDGNYSGTMDLRFPACDTVIFLDFPRTVCVYRILKRVLTYRKGTRPDMPTGCDEKFDWAFTKWVWNYPKRSKPKVEALLKRFANEKTIIRLKSKREIEHFFVNIRSGAVKS